MNRLTTCSLVTPAHSSSVISPYLRMQIPVCLTSAPSPDRVSDRNSVCCTSVSPSPLWSHEAPAGSVDESPSPADAGNGKLALTAVCLVVANREAVSCFQMRGCTGGAGGRWAALIKENESNNCVSDRCLWLVLIHLREPPRCE